MWESFIRALQQWNDSPQRAALYSRYRQMMRDLGLEKLPAGNQSEYWRKQDLLQAFDKLQNSVPAQAVRAAEPKVKGKFDALYNKWQSVK